MSSLSEKLLQNGTKEQLMEEADSQLLKIKQKNDVLQQNIHMMDRTLIAVVNQQKEIMERDIQDLKRILDRLDTKARTAIQRKQVKHLRDNCQKEIDRYGVIIKNFIKQSFGSRIGSFLSMSIKGSLLVVPEQRKIEEKNPLTEKLLVQEEKQDENSNKEGNNNIHGSVVLAEKNQMNVIIEEDDNFFDQIDQKFLPEVKEAQEERDRALQETEENLKRLENLLNQDIKEIEEVINNETQEENSENNQSPGNNNKRNSSGNLNLEQLKQKKNKKDSFQISIQNPDDEHTVSIVKEQEKEQIILNSTEIDNHDTGIRCSKNAKIITAIITIIILAAAIVAVVILT